MAFRNTPIFKRYKLNEKTALTPKKNSTKVLPTTPDKATPSQLSLGRRSKSSASILYTPSVISANRNSASHAMSTPKAIRRLQALDHPETPDYFTPVSIETPRRFAKSASDISRIVDEYKIEKEAEIANLKVAVRVRPMNVKECSNYHVKKVVTTSENEVTVNNGTTADGLSGVSHTFQYDYVFWSSDIEDPDYADQTNVFETLAKPLVDGAFEGYNICLFAYGQTGSGKSYSMMGMDSGLYFLFYSTN